MAATPPTRKIGSASVPYPGLGCMGMSMAYAKTTSDQDHINLLKQAYESGQTFWDTADIYSSTGMNGNEELLGAAIKQIGIPRKDLFIATKFGNIRRPDGSRFISGKPEYVKEAFARSLEALQTDYVDLYYQHRVDANTPIEETVKAMAELQKDGKVRFLGLSECSAATLRRACKVAKIDALQIEYSLWQTDIETNGILDACKELGVAVVAYSPLGRGFLSGELKSPSDLKEGDFRKNHPRFSSENFAKNLELVKEVEKLARRKGCTNSQLALAWVHAQGPEFLAIPGTTSPKRLVENLGCNDVHLDAAELREIRDILDNFRVSGAQYQPEMQKAIGL